MYTTISQTVTAYNEMLDEHFPVAIVAGAEYEYSYLLDELDPIAYKCGWLDWCDSEGIDTDELVDDYTFTRDRY